MPMITRKLFNLLKTTVRHKITTKQRVVLQDVDKMQGKVKLIEIRLLRIN